MTATTKEYSESVARATDEARRLNRPYVSTEHLLLGLIVQSTGSAAQTLISQGVNFENVSEEAEKLMGSEPGFAVEVPFSCRTAAVFDRSEIVAQELSDEHVGTKHILIALIDNATEDKNESRVAQVLESLGIDLEVLRAEAVKALNVETLPTGGCFIIEKPKRAKTRRFFRILISTISGICSIACAVAVLVAWGAWEVPLVFTTMELGGHTGMIPMSSGKDFISPMLLVLAAVLALLAIITAITARKFLKDKT